MEFVSKTSGRVYDIEEAVEPRVLKKNVSSDILIIFDWEKEENPIIVDYIFGAAFLEENMTSIQEIITKYEKENKLI